MSIRKPKIDAPTPLEQIKQIRSYLFQLVDELENELSQQSGGGTNFDSSKIATEVQNALAISRQAKKIAESVNDVANELKEAVENLTYTPIKITSLTVTPSKLEKGATANISVKWATNKTPKSQTINGASESTSVVTKSFNGVTTNTTYTLTVTGDKGETDTRSASVQFINGVYYGVASKPTSYDSAFIKGLEKTLQTSRAISFDVTAGTDEYIYYCLPLSYGTPTFTVGILPGGFEFVEDIQFTNSSGYVETYNIYKSVNANLGVKTVVVS